MDQWNQILSKLEDRPFLTDGGLETTIIFEKNIDLPEFAAFPLFEREKGASIIEDYYQPYIRLALDNEFGFILESPTWRASRTWGKKLGYGEGELDSFNQRAINLLQELRLRYEERRTPMIISGCMGPSGDGYHIATKMTRKQAAEYHTAQILSLAAAGVDMVSAFTMNYVDEAIGITLAGQSVGIPVVISFTVETDGRLPSGRPLYEAVEAVDSATDIPPLYYMINCAHPTHFAHALAPQALWVNRLQGVRANASKKSHEELDTAEDLDSGDPVELAQAYTALLPLLPNLRVFGGCCGTDHKHIEAIADIIPRRNHLS